MFDEKIRFVGTNYERKFTLDNNGVIQVSRKDGTRFFARCHYVDDFHMSIMGSVYHILEFAGLTEKNDLSVQPEEASSLTEVVWSLGYGKAFLAIQECDDGWDYSIYDSQLVLLDGGQIDDSDLSIEMARDNALTTHFKDLDKQMYYAVMEMLDYEPFMDRVAEEEEKRAVKRKEMIDSLLRQPCDSILILQMHFTKPFTFFGWELMEKKGYYPTLEDYEPIYICPVREDHEVDFLLEEIYEKFNLYRPQDFAGHSLSVSDVVLLKRKGAVTAYMVDSIGFKPLNWEIKMENN